VEGRVMAIADAYDAIISKRPYKEALPHEEAVRIIVDDSGSHFDPLMVKAFINVSDDFQMVN
jgi:putative two-component system response regulator